MFRKTSLLVFLSTVLGVVPCIAESFQDQQKDYLSKIKENVYPIFGASAVVLGSVAYWTFGRRRQGLQATRLNKAAIRLASAIVHLPDNLGISSPLTNSLNDDSYAIGKASISNSAKIKALSPAVIAAARTLINLLQTTTTRLPSHEAAVRAAVAGLVQAELEAASINSYVINSQLVQARLQRIYQSLTFAALDSGQVGQGTAENEEINLGNLPGVAGQVAELIASLRRMPTSDQDIRRLAIQLMIHHPIHHTSGGIMSVSELNLNQETYEAEVIESMMPECVEKLLENIFMCPESSSNSPFDAFMNSHACPSTAL